MLVYNIMSSYCNQPMNYKGWNLDNIHEGNVLITEDLEIDGDLTVVGAVVFDNLIVNDLTIGNELDMGGNPILDVGSSTGATSFYEFYTESPNWSGPFAVPVPAPYKLIRIGKHVTLTMSAYLNVATSSAIITLDTAIPSRFRPATTLFNLFRVTDDGISVYGNVQIKTTGIIEFSVGTLLQPFQGLSTSGWSSFSCTWETA